MRRGVLGWCAPIALAILAWLFVRQTGLVEQPSAAPLATAAPTSQDDASVAGSAGRAAVRVQKPRLLLAILTPVNLFTGLLASGLICVLAIWMDRRWLPRGLQPPLWLTGLNVVSAVVFLGLGVKGYWDNENRSVAVGSMIGVFAVAMLVAIAFGPRIAALRSPQAARRK